MGCDMFDRKIYILQTLRVGAKALQLFGYGNGKSSRASKACNVNFKAKIVSPRMLRLYRLSGK
jgi:hypothetical protein